MEDLQLKNYQLTEENGKMYVSALNFRGRPDPEALKVEITPAELIKLLRETTYKPPFMDENRFKFIGKLIYHDNEFIVEDSDKYKDVVSKRIKGSAIKNGISYELNNGEVITVIERFLSTANVYKNYTGEGLWFHERSRGTLVLKNNELAILELNDKLYPIKKLDNITENEVKEHLQKFCNEVVPCRFIFNEKSLSNLNIEAGAKTVYYRMSKKSFKDLINLTNKEKNEEA
jgi:hypothetical protein